MFNHFLIVFFFNVENYIKKQFSNIEEILLKS